MSESTKDKTLETSAMKRNRVKPEKYSRLGIQLSIPFEYPEILPVKDKIMEAICDRENLNKAYKNVLKNKGAAGIDGMTVDQLLPYLKENGQKIRAQLLDGSYKFHPVKQVEIPKAGGKGKRKLGIPTAVDRVICQAILQVLQKYFEPKFSKHSYGFRPNKSPHQAIFQAHKYVQGGNRYVVDIDLENFFDNVNHDKLMSEVAKTIKDKRLLKLLRRLLTAGILSKGWIQPSDKGTPQGNPLSPLLSNIMLDLLDKELEQRKHKFCRYADDCNVYVRSKKAGKRVMRSLTKFIEKKLKLKVNRDKSTLARDSETTFLGFSFTSDKSDPKIIVPRKTIEKFKGNIRKLTATGKYTSVSKVIENVARYCQGWLAYFGINQVPETFENLEPWIRTRLRGVHWKQWKTPQNRFKELRKLGIGTTLARISAATNKKKKRMSHGKALCIGLRNSYFYERGLPRFNCRTG